MPLQVRTRVSSIACIAAMLLLTGCAAPPPRPDFPDLRFNAEPPLRIDAARAEVQPVFQMSFHAPNVEHLFPVPPLRALENWGKDRLRPVGRAGRVVMTITNASVVETELPLTQGLTGAFTTQPSERYDLSIEAMVRVYDANGIIAHSATVRTQRSQSVLQDITPNDRDRTWYEMTKSAMVEFDRQMESEIRSNFGLYLVQ